ncbi:hypothetical protein [Scytonema sp. NUACC26]|uniref:hypothetical protein n=1 Tax=Scytonema sp. NUACC26 TaxID=3140176 RepID=UPI0038B38B02
MPKHLLSVGNLSDRDTRREIIASSGDRTRFALRFHRICCADRSRTIELPLVHQNLTLYNFYLLLFINQTSSDILQQFLLLPAQSAANCPQALSSRVVFRANPT